jgi:hypothetical protein
MPTSDPLRLAVLAVPLFLVGAGAGLLRAHALAAPEGSRRRRRLTAGWVLLLLAGAPLWLILAAVLRLW